MQTKTTENVARAGKSQETHSVIPAQAGIQERPNPVFGPKNWIMLRICTSPARAGNDTIKFHAIALLRN
jgi:hypothetical protein